MAMTLRLDAETSAGLRALSKRTGRSQQQIVVDSVRDRLSDELEELDRRRRRWRAALRRGNVCAQVPSADKLETMGDQLLRSADPDSDCPRLVKGLLTYPPVRPWMDVRPTVPSPPGGIMAILDELREERLP